MPLDQAALNSEIDTQLHDNTTRDISPATLRNVLHDIVNNPQVPPTSGSVSSANFASTLAIAKTTIFSAVVDGGPEWVQTLGYHAVGDYGGALYQRVNSLPVSPLTDIGTWTSADGAYWSMKPTSDEVWVSAFGAVPHASGDTSFDNWQAFEDCKYWILSNQPSPAPMDSASSFTMRVPPGYFYLSKAHSIEGGAYNIRGSGRGSIIRTPLGQDGIQIQHASVPNQTIGHEGGPISTSFAAAVGVWYYWPGGSKVFNCTVAGIPGATEPAGTGTGIVSGAATFDYVRPLSWSETRGKGAQYAKISDLTVFGFWDRGASSSTDDEDQAISGGGYHSGIVMRTRATVDHVSTFAYQGAGIAIVADGDPYLRGSGNANDWRLNRIQSYYNGHWGISVGYSDANAGLATDIDTSFNAVAGIRDAGFLLNKWTAVQSAYDGTQYGGGFARYPSIVVHNGYQWLARVQDIGADPAPNYHNEPGTDEKSWIKWSGDGRIVADSISPEWNSTDRYQASGCFMSDNINNRSSWDGVYIEGGTNPAQWVRSTLVWGGILGGNYDRSRGARIYDDGAVNNGLTMGSYFYGAAGPKQFNIVLGSPSQDGGTRDGSAWQAMQIQNSEGSNWTIGAVGPPSCSVTGSVANTSYSGTIIPTLTITAVTGGTGIFGQGDLVSGGSIPAHTHIARQINPGTGATITWVGGIGSYALDRSAGTVASTGLTINSDGTTGLDYAISADGTGGQPEMIGWMGQATRRKFDRNAVQPNRPFMRGFVLGGDGGFNSSGRTVQMGFAAPSAGDYGHGEYFFNAGASASGDGVLYYYCKTGPHAGTWQKVAAIP